MLREKQSTQRLVRSIDLKVQGIGTAAILSGGQHATLVDNGAGDWTISLVDPGLRMIGVLCQSITAATIVGVGTIVEGVSVQVLGLDAATGATPTDLDCFVQIVVSSAADDT